MPEVAVVIPAGGVGSRFGARTPKQFLRLGTMPILAATVQHFARHPAVRAVVVAAPEPWVTRAGRILGRVVTHTPLTVVAGGRTRQDSVWLALQAAPDDVEIIVVHDAVRPMITRRLVDTVVGHDCVVQSTFATEAEIGDGSVVGPFGHLPPGASIAPGTVTGPFYTS